MMKTVVSVLAVMMLLAGCGEGVTVSPGGTREPQVQTVRNPELPSWLRISGTDIRTITIQGLRPEGHFVIYPAEGSSTTLIAAFIDAFSMDKAIKPHATALSAGGQEWLGVKLGTGNSITSEMFPNEPTPTQFIVSLVNASGKTEKTAMISDVSGQMTSVFDSIVRDGDLVWLKT